MADLLFEILSEEIPARMQRRAAQDLADLVVKALAEQRVAPSTVLFEATPRRLVLALGGLPERQADMEEERKGPRVGSPDKAVEGFARSAGLAMDALEQRDTDKGPCWFAVVKRPGRAMAELLAELLPAAMTALPWPKSMRWGDHDVRWVRPIVSILALLDGAVVPFAFGPVAAGARTRGHRFLAPAEFPVTGLADYRAKLAAAHVLIEHAERRSRIEAGARSLAASAGLVLEDAAALLDEVAGLVEWPVPMIGAFDESFMAVPAEVLVTEMTQHQRYFPLRHADGRLAPRFVFVANTTGGGDGAVVTAGNQRVLAARLSDGRHFWDQDRRRRLDSRVGELDRIVFHARLGTVGEKVARIERLAENLAAAIPGCDAGFARRAARLAKADLTSEMVGEFPELQGVMGGYYARNDGEPAAVADAVAGHYAPQGPSDACPTAPVTVAVALADKLDTLAGFFAIDEKPTGSRDPFALRRAALGVIRLVRENGLRLPLREAVGFAREGYGEAGAAPAEAVAADLLHFFADRLKVHLREEGVRHDLVDAVFASGGDDDLVRLLARVAALQSFLASEDGANLLAAYRRAANIVRIEEKKDGAAHGAGFDTAKLVAPEERAVAAALAEAEAAAGPALAAEDFESAMSALARMRRPVDAFFDKVTVNAEDAGLRVNRLRLLAAIRATLDRVADFSRIEG